MLTRCLFALAAALAVAGPLPAQRILHSWSTRYVYPTLLFSRPIDSRISSETPFRTRKYLSQFSLPTRRRSDPANRRTSPPPSNAARTSEAATSAHRRARGPTQAERTAIRRKDAWMSARNAGGASR